MKRCDLCEQILTICKCEQGNPILIKFIWEQKCQNM